MGAVMGGIGEQPLDANEHPLDRVVRRRDLDRRAFRGLGVAVASLIAVLVWSPSNWLLFGERQPRGERVYESQGSSHCGWEDITFLGFEDGRYARDTEGEMGDTTVQYAEGIVLPTSVEFTGWQDGERELWAAPAEEDRDSVYIVTGDRVERWPRTSVGCY